MPGRFSRPELEAAITPALLWRYRGLHLALTAGPVLFFVVAASVATGPATSTTVEADTLDVLSMLNAGLLFVALSAGLVVFTRLREASLERAGSAAAAVAAIGRLWIVRQALLEASALFGTLVVLVAGSALAARPALWWNAVPVVALVVSSWLTVPTRERWLRLCAGE